MYVERLKVTHFRGIANMDIDFHEKLNVFIGPNGAGKSALLDCLAIMLSPLIIRIASMARAGRKFGDLDITNGRSTTTNEITVNIDGHPTEWTVTKTGRGRKSRETTTNLKQLTAVVEKIRDSLESKKDVDLPLAVYYPVHRAVLDIPLTIRRRHEFDQLSEYDQALSGVRNNFRLFFEWFRNREDLENEMRGEDPKYRDRELKAVRQAIQSLFPGSSGLRVRRQPLRMVLKKDCAELVVDQLSDGEKCQLALAGDLARRLAIANPSLKNPLDGNATVLIDEIDLHLHPSWQRSVISALQKTFPQCQFIITTHSPQIVSEVKRESIFLLRRCADNVTFAHPENAYGLDSNRVLEDIMEVDERPSQVKKKLERLFDAIDAGDLDRARRILDKLASSIGTDPQLVRGRTLLRRKEIIGR